MTPSSYEDAMRERLDEIFGAADPNEARTAFDELAADLEDETDRTLERASSASRTPQRCYDGRRRIVGVSGRRVHWSG